MNVLLADGVDDLITASEATRFCGVTLTTIYSWATRGYLTEDSERVKLQVVGLDRQGRKLFRLRDVALAERAARQRGRGRERQCVSLYANERTAS